MKPPKKMQGLKVSQRCHSHLSESNDLEEEYEQNCWLALQSAATYRLALHDSEIGRRVKESLEILEEALNRFGPDGLTLSFNGGKDCTVLLHLWAAVTFRKYGQSAPELATLYIIDPHSFKEIDQFVEDCVQRYNLNLISVVGNLKEGLRTILASTTSVKGVMVGARRTDPFYGNMLPFAPTDGDWPSCMRVHPMLDWSYQQIWQFLLELDIPYCNLYDNGYTSLGNTYNTLPNPALKNDAAPSGYNPAYLLADASTERDGRFKQRKS